MIYCSFTIFTTNSSDTVLYTNTTKIKIVYETSKTVVSCLSNTLKSINSDADPDPFGYELFCWIRINLDKNYVAGFNTEMESLYYWRITKNCINCSRRRKFIVFYSIIWFYKMYTVCVFSYNMAHPAHFFIWKWQYKGAYFKHCKSKEIQKVQKLHGYLIIKNCGE